jgi:hypothetical protein
MEYNNLKIPDKLQLFGKHIIFDCETFLHTQPDKTTVFHDPYLICAKFKRNWNDKGWFRDYQKLKHSNFIAHFKFEIMKFMGKSRHMMLIAHNMVYDFINCHVYYALFDAGFRLKTYSDGNPFFMVWERQYPYGKGKQTIFIQDNLNYFNTSLDKLSNVVGLPKWKNFNYEDESIENQKLAVSYCRNDCEIVDRALKYLCQFLIDNYEFNCLGGQGNFYTISGLTYKLFMLQYEPLIHQSHIDRIALERASYGGGRTEVFKMGTRYNQCYIDVNSLYPTVMSMFKIPYAYLEESLYPKELNIESLDKYAAIAKVTIYDLPNNKRFCGKQLQGRFCFPQGTFEAVLCTPELIYLINSGIKFELHEIVWYYHSYFLKDYIETTYENRLNASTKIEKDLFKLFMNSLYGKYGQKLKESIILELSNEINSKYEIIDDKKIYTKSFGGNKFQEVESDISNNTAVFVASHVTAYARMYLFKFIEIIGFEYISYCDTDSLIFDNSQRYKIESYLDQKKLGYFKIETKKDESLMDNITIEIRGLKDYTIDTEQEKIKGVSKKARKLSEEEKTILFEKTHDKKYLNTTYEVLQWNKLNFYIKDGQFNQYKGRIYNKALTRKYSKGVINDDNSISGIELDERGVINE